MTLVLLVGDIEELIPSVDVKANKFGVVVEFAVVKLRQLRLHPQGKGDG